MSGSEHKGSRMWKSKDS